MGLKTGTQFIVVAEEDVLIFKVINPPALKEFKTLISNARKAAEVTKQKVQSIVKKARQK